jgi:hypothetical protein
MIIRQFEMVTVLDFCGRPVVRISDELARLTASLLAENIVTETMK